MEDLEGWPFWWEFTRDLFLAPNGASTTDALRPSAEQIQRLVVPLLLETLKNEKNRELLDSSMIALARIGGLEVSFEAVAPFLKDPNTFLAETAAVALGILGDPRALPYLQALAFDLPSGRPALGPSEVPFRVRVFAAYGLGLLGRAVGDEGLRREVAAALLALLEHRRFSVPDLRVAAVIGLGLFDDPEGDRAISALLDLFDNRSEDHLVRAHVPVAVAKALNLRGAPALLVAKCVEKFSKAIDDRAEKKERVKESCVLALGLLTDPKSTHYGEVVKVLEHTLKEAPKQTQNFAAIALGFAGGEDAVKALRRSFFQGKMIVQPWVGLSLGVLAYRDRTSKRTEKINDLDGIVEDLTKAMKEEKNPEHASAYALALGLAGDLSAHDALAKRMTEISDEESRGYFGLGLGLLGDRRAREILLTEVKEAGRRPLLLQQAAIGLGLLSDPNAVAVFVERLKEEKTLLALAGVATALGYAGDQRSLSPLIDMARDRSLSSYARGFAIAALGRVADKDPFPWNSSISSMVNYRALTITLIGTNGGTGILDIL